VTESSSSILRPDAARTDAGRSASLQSRLARRGGPLSGAAFASLARHWRAAGVWLSVWDGRGAFIACDRQEGALWPRLARRSERLRGGLRDLARRSARSGETICIQPWGAGLGVAAIPIVERRRVAGIMLAAWLTGEAEQTVERLAESLRVDAESLIRLVAGSPRLPFAGGEAWQSLLDAMIRQARELESAERRVQSFTRNLSETYEELNLVYGVSELLSLRDSPAVVLQRVAEEVMTISGTAGLAIVLPGHPAAGAEGLRSSAKRPPMVAHRMGDASLDAADLERLAGAMGLAPHHDSSVSAAEMPPHVVRNDLWKEPVFGWLEGRVRHVTGFPLVSDGCWFGVLLALNRRDSGDFSSIEIKFMRAVADRVTSYLENQQLYDDLANLLMGLLQALISSIDAKDPYTCGHSERVAGMARRLAQQAGWPAAECQRVYMAGLLHDVGKIGVPDAILCKPGRLTDEEFTILRRHPEIGGRILSGIREVRDLLPGVLYHHERMDGRGYPARLAGMEIPALGRVICLADCFDAMTTSRTYRAALPVSLAMCELRRCSGSQFDPVLAHRLLEIDPHELLTIGPDAGAERAATPTPAATHVAGTELTPGGSGAGDAMAGGVVLPREELGRIVKDWQRLVRRSGR